MNTYKKQEIPTSQEQFDFILDNFKFNGENGLTLSQAVSNAIENISFDLIVFQGNREEDPYNYGDFRCDSRLTHRFKYDEKSYGDFKEVQDLIQHKMNSLIGPLVSIKSNKREERFNILSESNSLQAIESSHTFEIKNKYDLQKLFKAADEKAEQIIKRKDLWNKEKYGKNYKNHDEPKEEFFKDLKEIPAKKKTKMKI
ncbi:TPA: hypothetical protein NHK58_001425 [Pseudomonas aeruginosa]|nr:hypothetical protein [Pseudomonas aeruginosa]